MIDWTINDEEMRAVILSQMKKNRDDMIKQAERNETDSKDWPRRNTRDRMEDKACAAWSRRMAQHYQAVIDMIEASPMPE